MSSVRDGLEYLFSRLKAEPPITKKIDGQSYAVDPDGRLGAPIRALKPQWDKPTLQLSSLSGLVEAFKAGIDDLPKEVVLHITSYKSVDLIALKADDYGRRHVWASAEHIQESGFEFGKFYAPEDFLIAFRAGFLYNENAVQVERLASTVSNESSVTVADDGVSQAITVKAGVVTHASVVLPAEIPLIPWRTFREAAPVESKFLLRMKGDKGVMPHIAIIEIDAKWRLDTIASIATYLRKHLPEVAIIS